MFTGIIEEIGVVSTLIRASKLLRLSIYAKKVLDGTRLGDSIAVNGACLTVVEMGRNHFSVEVVEESLRTSSLSKLKIGDRVNLERALTLSARLGGHLTTGHIDGLAEIRGKIMKDDNFELILSVPRDLVKYIVHKGSVSIEGVSLTVSRITNEGIHVAVIPHTAQMTTLGHRNIGEKVNLEVDILAKYLEKLVQGDPPGNTENLMVSAGFMPLGIWEN